MIKNNPVRCAAPACAFYAVELGGLCEYCEREAFPPASAAAEAAEAEWIDANFRQAEIEAREAQWAEERELFL